MGNLHPLVIDVLHPVEGDHQGAPLQ